MDASSRWVRELSLQFHPVANLANLLHLRLHHLGDRSAHVLPHPRLSTQSLRKNKDSCGDEFVLMWIVCMLVTGFGRIRFYGLRIAIWTTQAFYGTTPVGCRGGGRYVYGFMVSWFCGFMVAWFYDFVVLWFVWFVWFYGMVVWFYGFIVSYFMVLWSCGCMVLWLNGFIVL